MTTTAQHRVFVLPDLGEGLTEAEILSWRVQVGSTVEADQVVVEVETVKATVELPVPYAGTVLELHGEEGAVVAVGASLVTVGSQATAPVAAAPEGGGREGGGREGGGREGGGRDAGSGSGHVLVGFGTDHNPAGRRRRRPPVAAVPSSDRAVAPLVISPRVRLLAREHGIDPAGLTPSGRYGVVLRRDVEQAIAQAAAVPPTAADLRPQHTPDPVERIPLRGRLRTAAEKLSRAGAVPAATTWVDVDATELLRTRDALRASPTGGGISLLALLARISVEALRRFPELNASVDEERSEVLRFPAVHLGFAAQTDRGLLVPVVRDAQRLTTAALAAELTRLTGLSRTGALEPRSLTGGTFTLNNYGVFGVDGSTPLVNHPQAAMLGVGRITDKPWVVDGQLAVRKVAQLSLTFDHRVCDGGTAGGFLRYVADCVERPALLLADL
ncbi:dihydrolipoamide acetyltransferase family protein [Peterkaempfera sp. SMS 1(5)a]|uniref:dihydrolipoamide acetyltransferase family protein n=1 Tax=Peterkaempfera podocarpi TaxID=3232308 RepID=UPI00367333B9